MTTTWFTSDSERAVPEQWTRVEVLASTARAAQAALDELPHHLRIPAGARSGPMPSRNTAFPLLPHVSVVIGEAYRDWTAAELEWQLRRSSGDSRLEVMVAHITGRESLSYSGWSLLRSSTPPVQSLLGGIASVATGAGDLAGGIGGAASGAGDVLGTTGMALTRWRDWIGPIVAIVLVFLLLALAWTSPQWIPKVIR